MENLQAELKKHIEQEQHEHEHASEVESKAKKLERQLEAEKLRHAQSMEKLRAEMARQEQAHAEQIASQVESLRSNLAAEKLRHAQSMEDLRASMKQTLGVEIVAGINIAAEEHMTGDAPVNPQLAALRSSKAPGPRHRKNPSLMQVTQHGTDRLAELTTQLSRVLDSFEDVPHQDKMHAKMAKYREKKAEHKKKLEKEKKASAIALAPLRSSPIMDCADELQEQVDRAALMAAAVKSVMVDMERKKKPAKEEEEEEDNCVIL
eukprot:TRINITY_DN67994_c3_g3_i1.p1 TRINITY_DN67994_c3_g3~~TRINITY_DN67994_c3_g3_i1.p1  ORF type:complete len:263 (+),score=158.84 TRINITY_DN67994_c3_g3_i1:1-789(+)